MKKEKEARQGSLLQIDAPRFCAGIVFENERCVRAAPILSWAKGKDRSSLIKYIQKKGWKTNLI